MTRARLISFLLAGSMMLSMVGCCWQRPALGSRLFPRWRGAQDNHGEQVCCDSVVSAPVMTTVAPPIITTQPPVAPAPRVVPVPQTAAPIQYTP